MIETIGASELSHQIDHVHTYKQQTNTHQHNIIVAAGILLPESSFCQSCQSPSLASRQRDARQSLDSVVSILEEMAAYRLYTIIPRLLALIDELTNWYIRFNRKRLKGEDGLEDTVAALNTLFETLFTLCRTMVRRILPP